MDPIWGLLRSKQNDAQWNPRLRGYLKSVICNRQWTQVRLKAAGLASHDKCTLCLQKKIEECRRKAGDGQDERLWFVDEVKMAKNEEHEKSSGRWR